MTRTLIALAVGILVAASITFTHAASPDTASGNAGADYIEMLQNTDGGFPAFGSSSSPGATLDTVFALVAVDRDPLAVTNGGSSPADYLATQASSYAADPGAAAKLSLGVSLMGLDPSSFGGEDLIATMAGHYTPATGEYGLDLFDEALYLLALVAEGEPVPTNAVPYVESVQLPDGGWEFASGAGSDTNTTAMVMQALIGAGAGATAPSIAGGVSYLAGAQNGDAGFGFTAGSSTDANSTALVLQALVAAGEDIDAGGPWEAGGTTPLPALVSFQNPTTGAFQFSGSDSPFATYQAVPGVMLAPFPGLRAFGPTVGGVAQPPAVAIGAPGGGGLAIGWPVWLAAAGGLSGLALAGGYGWRRRRRAA